MWSDIVHFGQRPTPMFVDGAAIPSRFGDVKSQYEASIRDEAVNPNVTGQHAKNAGKIPSASVPGYGTSGEPPVPQSRTDVRPRPGVEDVRSGVQSEGDVVSKQAKGQQDSFASKHELERDKNGTLSARKSLIETTKNAVTKDVKDMSSDLSKQVENAYHNVPERVIPEQRSWLLDRLMNNKRK